MKAILMSLILCLVCPPVFGQVERAWLTHRTNDPSKIVVSWTTKTPIESVVRFGITHAQYTAAQVVNILRQAGIEKLPVTMLISLARTVGSLP